MKGFDTSLKPFPIIVNGLQSGICRINGQPADSLTISKVKKGTRFFLEEAENRKPLISKTSGSWKATVCDMSQIKIISTGQKKIKLGLFGEVVASYDETSKAAQIGESSFLILEAEDDDAKLSIGAHSGGKIIRIEAGKIPGLFRKGSFLFGQEGIILDRHTISAGGKTTLVAGLMDGCGYLQKISGKGFYFIEFFGGESADITPLYPGETISVVPSFFVGGYNIEIIDVVETSHEEAARRKIGISNYLVFKAGAAGGSIITTSQSMRHLRSPSSPSSPSE